MKKMETTSMCRICLAVDTRMYSLVSTHLQDVYEELSKTALETQDERPTQACYICFARLKNCYQLRQSCVQSEELLTEMLSGGVLVVNGSCRRQKFETVHPVVQLSVGGVPTVPTPACHPDKVKIEPRESNDDAAIRQEGADLDSRVLVLNSEFDISVDIVKVEPEPLGDQSGNYALVLETCQQTQKSYEVTSNNDKKSMEPKPGTRKMKTCIKQKKYKENMNILDNNCSHSRDRSIARKKPKQHTCDVCQKHFTTKAYLKIHMCSHTGERPYQCSVCEKCFVQNNDLVKHMRTHTGEKPYQCNVCKKCFGQKHSLIGHIRTHTGEKPYMCSLCNKSFADNSTYRGHIFTHSGKKPYQCDLCQKTYSRQYHLNRHTCFVRHIP